MIALKLYPRHSARSACAGSNLPNVKPAMGPRVWLVAQPRRSAITPTGRFSTHQEAAQKSKILTLAAGLARILFIYFNVSRPIKFGLTAEFFRSFLISGVNRADNKKITAISVWNRRKLPIVREGRTGR
jgi:hypothetical protein